MSQYFCQTLNQHVHDLVEMEKHETHVCTEHTTDLREELKGEALQLLQGGEREGRERPLANTDFRKDPHASQPLATQLKQIHLQYFAVLREVRGCSEETLETQAQSVGELYSELQARYGFHLTVDVMRAALNGTFCDWDAPLSDGDALVFIPPVAGG